MAHLAKIRVLLLHRPASYAGRGHAVLDPRPRKTHGQTAPSSFAPFYWHSRVPIKTEIKSDR